MWTENPKCDANDWQTEIARENDERTNPTSWLFLVQVSILHDSPHNSQIPTRHAYTHQNASNTEKKRVQCALVRCHNVFYHYKFESRVSFFSVVCPAFIFFCSSFLQIFSCHFMRATFKHVCLVHLRGDATLRWFAFKWHNSVCVCALVPLLSFFSVAWRT